VPSGENVSVDQEVRWLREAGVDVIVHEVSNDEVLGGGLATKLRAAGETVWSPRAASRFGRVVERERPDLIHVHNLFPLLTASVPWAGLRRRVPVVWTARNLRTVCVEGTHFRAGGDCTDCRPGWRVPGIRHGCYRGSVAASALVTGATSIFRRLARTRVTTIATSETMRRWLVSEAGFAPDRVWLKYNGAPEPAPLEPVLDPARSSTFVFVGKFAAYKGIDLLLDAWRRVTSPAARLCFVGDGPEVGRVEAAVAADDRITWTGRLPMAGVVEQVAAARAVVVPSVWEEPFGRVAIEAFALGRPVITTGRGGLHEVVGDEAGWITGTDPDALARAIDEAAASDAEVSARGAAGRDRHARLFTPKATTAALLEIYQATLDQHHEREGFTAQ
jgi:glycosyltransferase involved in cell wall biosynthesis